MRKFIVNVSYAGCIQVTVEAKDEAAAEVKAENYCTNLTGVEFLDRLDPQREETYVVEEIIDE